MFDTKLEPHEEVPFLIWKILNAPNDSGHDYDLRGAFKAGITLDPSTGHWPDTYKKPNHPTFSNESIYAKQFPEQAGSWNENKFIQPKSSFGMVLRNLIK